MIIITIPFKTPTVNHLYFNWKNRRILTKEARILKEKIAKIVKDSNCDTTGLLQVEVQVNIHENWYTKAGAVARKDVANREKFLIDSIFKALGIDDKYIFKHTMTKVQSDTEMAVIHIYRHHP
jgi:Holliday junction resolvase RusA-like endonuclease